MVDEYCFIIAPSPALDTFDTSRRRWFSINDQPVMPAQTIRPVATTQIRQDLTRAGPGAGPTGAFSCPSDFGP